MIWLVLGLLLWTIAHLFKSVAPERRAAVTAAIGSVPSKVVFAVGIAAGLLAMIYGYRTATPTVLWTLPSWSLHLNNLLMLIAVFVYGMSMSKGRTRAWLRHPQLTAVVIWAGAHLLVNGDLPSLVLFGGLGLWAIGSMAAINARDGAWVRPEPGPAKGDVRLVVITLVLYAAIAAIHTWLGYWPFAG